MSNARHTPRTHGPPKSIPTVSKHARPRRAASSKPEAPEETPAAPAPSPPECVVPETAPLGGWLAAQAGLVALLYALTARGSWIYDDFILVTQTPRPRTLSDLLASLSAAHWNHLPYYRPLSRLMLAVEHGAFASQIEPYHLVNAALAAAVGALTSHLVRRTVPGVSSWLALAAGLAVALHPCASEGVYAASAGPETVAYLVCVLASVSLFLRRGERAYVGAMACFAAGLLCKEQAVVTPALFVAADLCALSESPPAPTFDGWARRYIPVALITAAWWALRESMIEAPATGRFALLRDPLAPAYSALYTLQSVVAPFFALRYEPPFEGWYSPARQAVAILAAVAVGALASRRWPTPRAPVNFWGAWFALAIMPTANVFTQETRFAERYVMLALPGAVGVLAAVATAWSDDARVRRAAPVALAVMAAALGAVTLHRSVYFRDNQTFLNQWRVTDPEPVRALGALGEAAERDRHWTDAARYYQRALDVNPRAARHLRRHLGIALENLGDDDGAEREYRRALADDRGDAFARIYLDRLLRRTGRPADPPPVADTDIVGIVNRGVRAMDDGRIDDAIRDLRDAIAQEPRWQVSDEDRKQLRAKAHYNLGRAYGLTARNDEAEAEYRAALREDPNYAYAHTNLGLLLNERGRFSEAEPHFQAALRAQPQLTLAQDGLTRARRGP